MQGAGALASGSEIPMAMVAIDRASPHGRSSASSTRASPFIITNSVMRQNSLLWNLNLHWVFYHIVCHQKQQICAYEWKLINICTIFWPTSVSVLRIRAGNNGGLSSQGRRSASNYFYYPASTSLYLYAFLIALVDEAAFPPMFGGERIPNTNQHPNLGQCVVDSLQVLRLLDCLQAQEVRNVK
jgi:hypothetical protein